MRDKEVPIKPGVGIENSMNLHLSRITSITPQTSMSDSIVVSDSNPWTYRHFWRPRLFTLRLLVLGEVNQRRPRHFDSVECVDLPCVPVLSESSTFPTPQRLPSLTPEFDYTLVLFDLVTSLTLITSSTHWVPQWHSDVHVPRGTSDSLTPTIRHGCVLSRQCW